MLAPKTKSWQCPQFEELPQSRQGWATEAIQEGESWLKSQTAYASYDNNIRLITSGGGTKLSSNALKPDIRKFVETISDIRKIAEYGGADYLKDYVKMFNAVIEMIYRTSHFPRQSRKALQYAMAGRGYLWPRYIRKDFGWGEGNIEFKALSMHQVLPVQLPDDHDVQGSYATTIMDCLGMAEAHGRFPKFQDQLLPMSKAGIHSSTQVRRMEHWDNKYKNSTNDWENRYCEIAYTFIRDLRINETGQTLPMGDKGTSWYYEVPSLGSQLVTTNPDNGLPQSRVAGPEDCRIYPQLRLIISNPGMSQPLYDGPAFDWHGIIPAIAYDVDDWPWMAMGLSLVQDVAGGESARREFLSLMYRVLKARMNPPKGYDLNAGIPNEHLKRMDWLNEEGTMIGVDGQPTAAVESILPESVDVKDSHFKLYELIDAIRQKTLGLNDIAALANLKFNLSSETADKILESIGPIAKGIASNMEVAHSKIAYMLKFMIPQYYPTKKLISMVGPDAVASLVFDHEPTSLIPSHLPGEEKLAEAKKKSNKSLIDRAKWFAQNLQIVSLPSFLLNVTAMQEQMKYLNFMQQKLPISFATCMKKLGVENWGESPGATEFEKWQWEQREIALAQVGTMQTVAGELPQQPGQGAPSEGGDGGAQNPGAGQGKGGGRPPSGKNPPKLEMRGNTTGKPRTVISQSK